MSKREFTGKTLDEAIDKAVLAFDVDRSLINYLVLPSAKKGLLSKLFSREIRIDAWCESSEKVTDAAREAVREIMKKNPRGNKVVENTRVSKASDNIGGEARAKEVKVGYKPREPQGEMHRETAVPRNEMHKNLLPLENPEVNNVLVEFKKVFLKSFFIDEQNCVQAKDEVGNVVVSVKDVFLEDILSRSDKLSIAFEHIFKRVAQKKVGDTGGRVFLSAGDSDKNREDKLKNFAFSLAEKVKKTGKSITISSKTSQERRIIHMTLDGFSGIATKSIGVGDKRKLIIFSTFAKRGKPQYPQKNAPRPKPIDNSGQPEDKATPPSAQAPRKPRQFMQKKVKVSPQ